MRVRITEPVIVDGTARGPGDVVDTPDGRYLVAIGRATTDLARPSRKHPGRK